MKNGVKNIQTAGYNGVRTVIFFCTRALKLEQDRVQHYILVTLVGLRLLLSADVRGYSITTLTR